MKPREPQFGQQITQIKRLLDQLGQIQDLTVQVRYLEATGEALAEQAEPGTLLAIGVLYARQRAIRDDFAEVFAAFGSSPSH